MGNWAELDGLVLLRCQQKLRRAELRGQKATPVITARLRSFLCRCTRHVIVLAISGQPFSHILTLNQLTD